MTTRSGMPQVVVPPQPPPGGGSSGPTVMATALTHPLPDIIDYKVKLLGLLPDGYMYHGGTRRWDLSTACFIKFPSEMTCYEGKMDKKGHPTLIGSGILERKYGLTVHLPTLAESERAASAARGGSVKGGRVVDDEDDDDDDDEEEDEGEVDITTTRPLADEDVILEEDEDEGGGGDESGNESGSEGSEEGDKIRRGGTILGGCGPSNFVCQGCQHNAAQNQKDNLMTKWLKYNFDPRRDMLPDIVCRRTVLTYIMTQKQPYILNAKKISFTSAADPERREYKVIHVEFDYLPNLEFEPRPPGSGGGGERISSRAGTSGSSKTPDGLPTSEKNFDAESYYEKPNLIGYFAGKLSCKVPTMPPENRSIRILLSAIVDGLWRYKHDPELYTVHDLAEVKSTMDTTVVSDPKKGGNPHFFKQVRMAHAWAQCHLVGINRMMVGVHTMVPGDLHQDGYPCMIPNIHSTHPCASTAASGAGGAQGVLDDEPAYALTSRPKRILQELWLYDVEKMPNAVKISGDEDGFRAWTPTDLKWKLYTALQQIRAQVRNSDDGVTHRFLHYFNEDFLVPMTLEELQSEWKAIHEAYRTLIFKNVHIVQTSPDVIDLSMEEVEQEHAEKQIDHILNTFLGMGIPIETVKVVRVLGAKKDLEVMFPYEALARRVYTTFKLLCVKNNRFLPRGFDKIKVEVKRTKRQELERVRRKGIGGVGASMFYLVRNPPPQHQQPQSSQQTQQPRSSSQQQVPRGTESERRCAHRHHHQQQQASSSSRHQSYGDGRECHSSQGHHHHHHPHHRHSREFEGRAASRASTTGPPPHQQTTTQAIVHHGYNKSQGSSSQQPFGSRSHEPVEPPPRPSHHPHHPPPHHHHLRGSQPSPFPTGTVGVGGRHHSHPPPPQHQGHPQVPHPHHHHTHPHPHQEYYQSGKHSAPTMASLSTGSVHQTSTTTGYPHHHQGSIPAASGHTHQTSQTHGSSAGAAMTMTMRGTTSSGLASSRTQKEAEEDSWRYTQTMWR